MKDFNWVGGTFLISYHLVFIVLLPVYLALFTPHLGLIVATLVLIGMGGLGITAGYHRFYSHRSYVPSRLVEPVLLFCGTLAFQGSAIEWCHDHRRHHWFVDTDKDPYSIKKGFWYAHFLWMMERRKVWDESCIADLMRNPLVRFQHRFYVPCVIAANLSMILLFGALFADFFGALVFVFLARLFVNHHTTWFINSLAHTWGSREYSTEHSAVDNWVIALLTYGEGYHNYHHTFALDYRNGVRWYQFDPTKVLIWVLSKLGLASKLRKADDALVKKRLLLQDRQLLLEKLRAKGLERWQEFEHRITALSENLSAKIVQAGELVKSYRELKRARAKKDRLKELKAQIREVKKSIQRDFKAWRELSRTIHSVA